MLKPYSYTVLLIVLFTIVNSSHSKAKESLIWLTDDKKDLVDLHSPDNISIGTDTTKLVLSALTDYDIDFQLVQLPRAKVLMKSMDNLCMSNRVKTKQRMQDNIFSLPVNVFPSLRLYYLADNDKIFTKASLASLLNEQGELISLAHIFEHHPEALLAITKGRSFGEIVDKQIQQIPKGNLLNRAGDGRYQAMMHMLFKGRIDFIIDFPVEMKRELDAFDKPIALTSLAIANTPDYIVGHIACSKSDLGKRVVRLINTRLLALYQDTEFFYAHSRYLADTDLINFAQYYKDVFKSLMPVEVNETGIPLNNINK